MNDAGKPYLRMRIATFCSNYPPHPGGLEVVAASVASGLAVRNDVKLVTTAWDGRHGRAVEGNVIVHRLPAIHSTEARGVPYPLPFGPGIRTALEEVQDANVIHAHGSLYATTLLAAHFARRRRLPLVLTEHVGFVRYRSRMLNAVQRAAWATVGRRVLDSTSHATVLNERVSLWMRDRLPGDRVHFIRNGVDTTRFQPSDESTRRAFRAEFGLPPSEVLVLFVGRAVEKKNLDAVLDLNPAGYSLVLCGSRQRRSRGGHAIDLGVLPHSSMPRLLAAVDALVHASTDEGFPVAVQEAMAAGLPVALLWDPSYSATLDRGAVAACDTIAELEAVLSTLAHSPDRRRELGQQARDWAVHHWSWSTVIDEYEAIFRRAIAEQSNPNTERS